MNQQEQWRPVVGWPDYLVSDQGRVASLKRGEPQLLRGTISDDGYRVVTLRTPAVRQIRPVHILVAEAFIGPRPDGLETRHLDGDSLNNRVGNLRYGTHSDNMQDRLAHGRHPMASKTHCLRDHEFTAANTYVYRGSRFCRACKRLRENASALRAASVPSERAA